MTHPSFISFNNNGYWVGKFELTGTIEELTVLPSTSPLRMVLASSFFDAMYNYNRALDSHMIKNTEWGAIFYLSHSKFGTNASGYSLSLTTEEDKKVRDYYYTETGLKDSTTGNLSGIFYMGGGVQEYTAGVKNESEYMGTEFEGNPVEIYGEKYFDLYETCKYTNYSCRILGDATGEIGPFHQYDNGDSYTRVYDSWYNNRTYFLSEKWFSRGGGSSAVWNSRIKGINAFNKTNGTADNNVGSRMVLGG